MGFSYEAVIVQIPFHGTSEPWTGKTHRILAFPVSVGAMFSFSWVRQPAVVELHGVDGNAGLDGARQRVLEDNLRKAEQHLLEITVL